MSFLCRVKSDFRTESVSYIIVKSKRRQNIEKKKKIEDLREMCPKPKPEQDENSWLKHLYHGHVVLHYCHCAFELQRRKTSKLQCNFILSLIILSFVRERSKKNSLVWQAYYITLREMIPVPLDLMKEL